jgi:hypothetical protein
VDLVTGKIVSGVTVRLPKHIANPGLAALIEGAGFRSLERFAVAVNVRGWEMSGLKLSYDHVTVKRWLAFQDADVGGALSREAAVGQLKYAVDLVRYASYSNAVGNRLLTAVAELAGVVGWMCHDSGMRGPAQRYLIYGLQAARESTDPRAPLVAIGILRDLGRHAHWAGQHATSLQVLDLALNQLPNERSRFKALRAVLWGNKAWTLASMGPAGLPEARNGLSLAADLAAQASDEDRVMAVAALHELPTATPEALEAQLSITTSCAYLTMAQHDRGVADEAQARAVAAVARTIDKPARHSLMAQIRLARARLAAGEPDQACEDGDMALTLAESSASAMVTRRLRELAADTEPYREQARARELRERLRVVMTRG